MSRARIPKEQFLAAYQKSKLIAENFEGMMDGASIILFEALLGLQNREQINGNCIEFGVYRGRSASVILSHLRPGERMMLVEANSKYPELDKLRAVNPSFELVCGKSEALINDPRLEEFISQSVRFSHHDASHSFVNVSEEMRLMESHICPKGIMVLDDYCNPHYMQVVAACFNFLCRKDCELTMFLSGFNKAYLCRKSDFDFFKRFVLDELLDLVRACGPSWQLSRTEDSAFYRGFSILPQKPHDPSDHYGVITFGDRYYR